MIKQRRPIEKFGLFHSGGSSSNYSDDNTFDENIAIYRSRLSENDRKIFDYNRTSKYWLTFAVCCIYGLIALIILLLGSFTSWGNKVFFNDLYIFIITYIIGTIIIIIFLTYKVYNFDFPSTENILDNSTQYCPDYWSSKKATPGYFENADGSKTSDFGDDISKQDFFYKCKLKNENIKNGDIYQTSKSGDKYIILEKDIDDSTNKTGLTNAEDYKKFREIAARLSGYNYNKDTDICGMKYNTNALQKADDDTYFENGDTIPLKCDTVYPLYFAKEDLKYSNENNSSNKNIFRCAYSKACSIPWTDIGCTGI